MYTEKGRYDASGGKKCIIDKLIQIKLLRKLVMKLDIIAQINISHINKINKAIFQAIELKMIPKRLIKNSGTRPFNISRQDDFNV